MAHPRLHLPSALAGACFAVVVLISTAFLAPSAIQRVAVVWPIEVQGIPGSEDLLRIPVNQPFQVPQGKALVMTTVTGTFQIQGMFGWEIAVDAAAVAHGSNHWGTAHVLFWGIRAAPGSTVVLTGEPDQALLGYLADE